MRSSICSLLLASIAVLVCLSPVASAQGPRGARYQPARPTVSPYLDLFRLNTSPLPNYYTYVRPFQEQQAFNQQTTAALQQVRQGFQQSQALRQEDQTFAPTGTGATFRNFLHYYSGLR